MDIGPRNPARQSGAFMVDPMGTCFRGDVFYFEFLGKRNKLPENDKWEKNILLLVQLIATDW